jgi:DNA-binding NtrC family response regulator
MNTGKCSIFVIDDHTDTTEVLNEFLGLLGFKVEVFDNFKDAMSRSNQQPPCLVLADYVVPGDMQAREFIVRTRALRSNTKVLLVTGKNNIQALAAEIGADGFLQKPYSLVDVEMLVKIYCPK